LPSKESGRKPSDKEARELCLDFSNFDQTPFDNYLFVVTHGWRIVAVSGVLGATVLVFSVLGTFCCLGPHML
jgi:hypothetical protein